MKGPILFDSAYPGSMHERDNGDFVKASDNESMAKVMLNNIYQLELSVEDWKDIAIKMEKDRNALLTAATLLMKQYDGCDDFTIGGNLTNEPFLLFRAAIAKANA